MPVEARDGSEALVSNADRRIGALSAAIEKQDRTAIESALSEGATLAQELNSDADRLEGVATALATSDAPVTPQPDPTPAPEPVAPPPLPLLSPADRARVASLLRDADAQLAQLADLEGNKEVAAPDASRLTANRERTERAKQDLARLLAKGTIPDVIEAEAALTSALATMRSTMNASEAVLAEARAAPPEALVDGIRAYLAGDMQRVVQLRVDPELAPRVRAHLAVLKSAAYLHTSRASIQDRAENAQEARRWAQAAKRTDSSVAPDERFFPRDFLRLYRDA